MSQDLEPHVNLNLEHEAAIFQQSLVPDTLYRLRLSVLKDNNGHVDSPSQMFVCAPVSFIIYYLTVKQDIQILCQIARGS